MPSLSDKLKSLGVQVGSRELPAPRRKRGYPIEDVLPGRLHPTPNGDTYIVETVYPLDYTYGETGLQGFASLKTIAEWAGEGNSLHAERIKNCSSQAFAYLDIETTGLMGGTGTYAFLVGLGRFEQDGFHLAQFFMRDPIEEPAQLLAIEEFLAPCEALVTYNGKSFDVPLLTTRYISQSWNAPLASLAHVDLLHIARRLWRERLSSRTLGNVETFILGARRTEEDVPGWMIPRMYFDYLQDGDARPLKSVFYHNAMDVLAMAALLNHVTRLLEDPLNAHPVNPLDLAGIGRLYEDIGRTEEACQCYSRCLENDLPDDLRWETLKRLSFLKKRAGDYHAAVELWQQAALHKHIYAHVELAKHYEHRVGDNQEALKWTKGALDHILSPGFPSYARQEWLEELDHRLERLQRKLQINRK